jgi:hypothetical protein
LLILGIIGKIYLEEKNTMTSFHYEHVGGLEVDETCTLCPPPICEHACCGNKNGIQLSMMPI